MFKHFSLSTIFCSVLFGCGDSTDEVTKNAPLDNQYYGLWSLDSDAHVVISQESITLYSYDVSRGCFDSSIHIVNNSTADSLTATDSQTGETSTSYFDLEGEQLIVSEDGTSLTFEQNSYFVSFPGCESHYGVKEIEIEVELAFLPPELTINRDAQSKGAIEYDYNINFDLNKNDTIDSGDISIGIRHFKWPGTYSNNEQVTLTELGGNIWSHFAKQYSDNIISTSNGSSYNVVQVNQVDNVVSFKFAVTQNPLLAHINEDTPVKISAYLNYPEPETDVIDSYQDGPWNWSSAKHKDNLPDEGFITPSYYPNLLIDDGIFDLLEGESMWVDIKSVQFNFIY